MNNSNAIKDIDSDIKDAQKIVDAGKALEKLSATKEFKLIIENGYLRDEAIRLVHLKSAVDMQTADRQVSIIKQMDGVGQLAQYFNTVFHQASLAVKAIEYSEETRDELLSEDLNNV